MREKSELGWAGEEIEYPGNVLGIRPMREAQRYSNVRTVDQHVREQTLKSGPVTGGLSRKSAPRRMFFGDVGG